MEFLIHIHKTLPKQIVGPPFMDVIPDMIHSSLAGSERPPSVLIEKGYLKPKRTDVRHCTPLENVIRHEVGLKLVETIYSTIFYVELVLDVLDCRFLINARRTAGYLWSIINNRREDKSVLLQVRQFNRLLNVIHVSLKTLALCLQGDEAMNEGVDEMYQNILDNKLPPAWRVSHSPNFRITYSLIILSPSFPLFPYLHLPMAHIYSS